MSESACVRVRTSFPSFLIFSSTAPAREFLMSRSVGRSVGRNIFNYSHVACVVTGMMQVVWRVCGDVVLW